MVIRVEVDRLFVRLARVVQVFEATKVTAKYMYAQL